MFDGKDNPDNRREALDTWPSQLRRRGEVLLTRWIKRQFPDVNSITTSDLAAWLDDAGRSRPLLLDVRSRTEYETSFIDTARWVDAQAPLTTLTAELTAAARPVVVYCSAGYRSARFARRLQAAGIAPVYNLAGSIFAWANEGRTLNSPRGPTRGVHPYNAVFGWLLAKSHRSDRIRRR